MDRDKFSISIVPELVNREQSGTVPVLDPCAEWDAKWLRPNVTSMQPPPRPIPQPRPTPISRPAASVAPAASPAVQNPRPAAQTPRPAGQTARPAVRVASPIVQPVPTPPPPQPEQEAQLPDNLTLRFLRWLFPEVNQRRAKRFTTPNLVAYYWTGGAPYSYHVGDMSATGLFLLTKERWAPGTLIQMTLQPQDGKIHTADTSICVLSEVVRWGENGAGFNFVLSDYEDLLNYGIMPSEVIDRKSVERFLSRIGIPEVR